jgi:hypothetical protein
MADVEWLVPELTAEGYRVWGDRCKLLGGKSHPHDIDRGIREQTFSPGHPFIVENRDPSEILASRLIQVLQTSLVRRQRIAIQPRVVPRISMIALAAVQSKPSKATRYLNRYDFNVIRSSCRKSLGRPPGTP